MEQKINIAKLLKGCPSGMELDCMMYENLYFDSLNADYDGTISCYTLIDGIKSSINFSKYGTFNNHKGAKCVIFPKGKTTWEGFVSPCKFKDGDILYIDCNNHGDTNKKYQYIFILKEINEGVVYCYCCISNDEENRHKRFEKCCLADIRYSHRLTTEEEKQKLFDAIKANGYKWNEEAKTLEKLIEPRFKAGDRVMKKCGASVPVLITRVGKDYYYSHTESSIGVFPIAEQDDWVLVPDKFDINVLKPFESKVLVRDVSHHEWEGAIFGRYDGKKFFTIGGFDWGCCIPYEGNEHLHGTTNDCDDFYKNW